MDKATLKESLGVETGSGRQARKQEQKPLVQPLFSSPEEEAEP